MFDQLDYKTVDSQPEFSIRKLCGSPLLVLLPVWEGLRSSLVSRCSAEGLFCFGNDTFAFPEPPLTPLHSTTSGFLGSGLGLRAATSTSGTPALSGLRSGFKLGFMVDSGGFTWGLAGVKRSVAELLVLFVSRLSVDPGSTVAGCCEEGFGEGGGRGSGGEVGLVAGEEAVSPGPPGDCEVVAPGWYFSNSLSSRLKPIKSFLVMIPFTWLL